MIERLRRAFNASWTPSRYESYKARLAEAAGASIHFRVCETPVFLPPALRDEMVQGALEIFELLLRPEALERSKAAVPPEFDVPGGDDGHPLFAVVDFAIVDVDGRPAPRLIELQGFPSLFGFQLVQGRLCREMLPGEPLEFLLSGLDEAGYLRDRRRRRSSAACRPRTSCCSTSSPRSRAPTRTSAPARSCSGSAPCARRGSKSAAASCGTSATGARRASSASTTA